MKAKYTSIVGCVVLMACSSPGTLSDNGWDFLGEKWVNFGVDHDDLIIRGKDEYRQIQLRITDGPLRTLDMKVHFDQGGVQDVALRSMLRPGEKSRIIELDGGLRRLNKITFWYETLGFRNGSARVAVWGFR